MTDHTFPSSSNPRILSYEEYQKKVKNLKTLNDVNSFVKDLIAPVVQTMLESEMTAHLGYEPHGRRPKNGDNERNFRNGSSRKMLKTTYGEQPIEVPRDREGTFDPVAVRKYETVQSDVEERIIAMYAKGLTTRDINTYMRDIYGVEISADTVSSITDKVLPLVREWQSRPLSSLYVVLYLDGVHFKVRDGGKIVNRCAYVLLGINGEGRKEILGVFIAQTEGAKFWMQLLSEIKNRGVQHILICCIDGLTGFPEAIRAVFPQTTIQQCIVHQIRNSMKYVSHRHKDEFCRDLKTVYGAPNEQAGLQALTQVRQKWTQYEASLKSWETKWTDISAFFAFPEELRRIIYTTNAIESLNRQFRKVTKTTTIFPHDESLLKILWLAQKDITRKWTTTIPHWGQILMQLHVLYPDHITIS